MFDIDNTVFIVGVYVYFEDIKLNVFAENLPQHNAFFEMELDVHEEMFVSICIPCLVALFSFL